MEQSHKTINERFTDLADIISEGMGKWWVTAISIVLVLLWLAAGPFMHFSDTWQLIVNTPTTLLELWIGFLLAAATNRVERRHDALLKTTKHTTEADVETTRKNEQDIQEIKQDLKKLLAKEQREQVR
jgi:low affinity Fe/Cu permease